MASLPFLRIPPFPRRRLDVLAIGRRQTAEWDAAEAAELAHSLAKTRVGGAFWAEQPPLPPGRDIVLAPDTREQGTDMLLAVSEQGLASRAVSFAPWKSGHSVPALSGLCDPWHIAMQASAVHAGGDNELALVAALAGKPVITYGPGRFAEVGTGQSELNTCIGRELLQDFAFQDPFAERPMSPKEAIALLADWRRLIDANRQAAAIFGIAHWKRLTVNALLWDGSGKVRYASANSHRIRKLEAGDTALAWKTRSSPDLLERLAARGVAIGEIEDGMIRSVGLGANCVPPLSIIVDFLGAHFDPAQPSQLEAILQNEDIAPDLITRAAALQKRLVGAGIGKYGMAESGHAQSRDGQRRVLVTGQVEDDRSVLCGGAGLTNVEVVKQARQQEPDAWIIYKPHPDVEAGHRKGFVPDAEILRHADEIERKASIMTVMGSVDAVHVITSLAGFEALMRGKQVTTHGVPFYAGWGLTRDLGLVPQRRTRERTLDELVAATLILYPRYLDPVTRLPCPVEVLVERFATGQAQITSPLVRLREAQGQLHLLFKYFMGSYR